MSNGRTVYQITVLLTAKRTYSEGQVDVASGDVINAKPFGELPSVAESLRKSAERNANIAQ